jgi:uncharacterized protein
MGIRYILLGLALWLLFTSIRGFIRKRRQRRTEIRPGSSVNMVACKQCGVHIPKNEAIYANKNYYCCIEHSRLNGKKEEEK